jgi:hypothetical protein
MLSLKHTFNSLGDVIVSYNRNLQTIHIIAFDVLVRNILHAQSQISVYTVHNYEIRA